MTNTDGGKRFPAPEEIIEQQRETIAFLHDRIIFLEKLVDGLWAWRNKIAINLNVPDPQPRMKQHFTMEG